MKFGLISTQNTNIGDDFIRQGIINVLLAKYAANCELLVVNKHRPLDIYNNKASELFGKVFKYMEHNRWLYRVSHTSEAMTSKLFKLFAPDILIDVNYVIECGMPVLYPKCNQANWARIIWPNAVFPRVNKIPFTILAAGACYPWETRGQVLDSFAASSDGRYAQNLVRHAHKITVRDALCQKLFKAVGSDPALLPCTAFLAGCHHLADQDDGIAYVNFMEGGGHFEWGQNIDSMVWRQSFLEVLRRLRTDLRVVWIAHNEAEKTLAQSLAKDDQVIMPRDPMEYFSATNRGTVSLCNRLHASVALAGMGIPGVAIGTDTRLLMVENLGQHALYVKDACDADYLYQKTMDCIVNRNTKRENLLKLSRDTLAVYADYI